MAPESISPSKSSSAADVASWIAERDVSARSLLVTIFGDSILPVTTSVWLSQLFELTAPFGFSQRLIRTSLFRLGSDNWVTNERVGRQSRYALTPMAMRESADADRRIYISEDPAWDGSWTLVLVDGPTIAAGERDEIIRYLRWHGFVALGRGVMASPTTRAKTVADLLADLELTTLPVIVDGEIHDLDRLVAEGLFTGAFDMVDIEAGYVDFLTRYRSIRRRKGTDVEPLQAYTLRTMLVHDFRRIRLREPDIPRTLLPNGWIGSEAYELAGELYTRFSPRAGEALQTILNTTYPATVPGRFPG